MACTYIHCSPSHRQCASSTPKALRKLESCHSQHTPTEPGPEQHSNHKNTSQSGARAGTHCQAPPGQTPGESRASSELLCFPSAVSGSELAQVSGIAGIFWPRLWLCTLWSTGTEGQQRMASVTKWLSWCKPRAKPPTAHPGARARMTNKDLPSSHCT